MILFQQMITILFLCIAQLDYKDNLLETIVNLLDFYSLNLWRVLSDGLGWSSHTVKHLALKKIAKKLFAKT